MKTEPSRNWEALFSSGPRRIVVTGANGAGKTVLARSIAARLGVPVLHNDAFALLDGWKLRPRSQTEGMRNRAVEAEVWVLEGGPSVLSAPVLARTDIVVWLDMPALLRLWRVMRRSVEFAGRTRPEHPPGNPEWPGRRQLGFLIGTWRRRHWFRHVVSQRLSSYDGPVLHLTTSRQARRLQEVLKG